MQNFHLSSMINMSMTSCCSYITGQQIKNPALYLLLDNQAHRRMEVLCSASKGSRGFSPRSKKEKANKVKAPSGDADLRAQTRKSISKPPDNTLNQPGSVIQLDGKSGNKLVDREFEERLEAVRSMALKQKKKEENKQYDIIDYDAAVEPKQSTIGLGTKVGVGVAVVVFGLLFAFGDFLPYISDNSNNEAITAVNTLTEEEKSSLKARLQQYEAKLSISMQDPVALEGAAVTLSELGDYDRASSFLEKLSKEKPMDPEVYRLLGEVRYKLKDYEGSVAAYKSSASVAAFTNFDVLRGLTNALLAANKPDEAVQVLLASRDRLGTRNSSGDNMQAPSKSGNLKMEMQEIDPIQVELLLGKAYTEWDHISDAISVYDRLISMHSDDFRGYLAKGILLKQIGKVGDAERMFIQARFFAPEKAKALVDRYSRQ